MTLTWIQFLFVNAYCFIGTRKEWLGSYTLSKRLVTLTRQQIKEIGQISVFNVLGHAMSSVAISRVPVSMVHTIKALSPLFTVLSYAYLFRVSYSIRTYASLMPLMLGVILACSTLSKSTDDVVGFLAALGSTLIFVAQNIYSKNLLKPATGISTATPEKMDKINIMFYSSASSVLLMLPMCLYYDAPQMIAKSAPSLQWHAIYLLFINGLVHFSQNLLAFQVLAHVSPVTYSIANLFKRVFVILLAIAWFGQHVTYLQWFGIVLTFVGLYMYNQSKNDAQVSQELSTPSQTESLPMHQSTPLPTVSKSGTHMPRARPRPANLSHAVSTPLFSLPPQ
ncbi:hypothetical protein MYAM1_002118 [Malassezia yamatoensis]|uniref:Sugar phosphate transporter domain-containing protein n=1 Tax=Malassezia yamatoensis TaxID=253288 RepID=A0AAJ6CH02_9BASI|nr:hypothetical protein MYAM1_002118 [Malassezia yamatoensis]